MAAAQGHCPNCGAPIEFAIGSSISKVCEFCRHTVLRGDRGLSALGKVADLAPTSALIAIGDEAMLSGRPVRVLGRVQLDYGKGPWDEYYVAFDNGQAWGWLAYAQGNWYATQPVEGLSAPPYGALRPELDVPLAQAGTFRVAEVRTARIVSAEGELPGQFPVGFERHYADVSGLRSAFGTLDYGAGSAPATIYLGWMFAETALSVTALGPRSTQKVPTTSLRCPNCGGDVPALAPDRSERLGCPYCGAVSDIVERTVVAQQAKARSAPAIPIGSRARFGDVEYVCIAFLRRGSDFEGEFYEWEEFLLWSRALGYRWLVNDPETGWSWVEPVNLAELDLASMPKAVGWGGKSFRRRNSNVARVTYVLGEVYWKCEVGETVQVVDFESGDDVLSREEGPGEVTWSHGAPVAWPVIAQAFGLSLDRQRAHRAGPSRSSQVQQWLTVLFVLVMVIIVLAVIATASGPGGAGAATYGTFRGGGVYTGGK